MNVVANRRRRWAARLAAAAATAIVVAACATARAGTRQSPCELGLRSLGQSTAGARAHADDPAACRTVARRCRWVIGNSRSPDRSETTPGSSVDRPPGSCPSAQLGAILALALRLQHAGDPRDDLCPSLAAQALGDARRVARAESVSCTAAAIRFAAIGPVTATQRLAQPLLGVFLFSQAPGPPHWFAYLTLGRRDPSRSPTRTSPITILLVRSPQQTWQISQIGYDP